MTLKSLSSNARTAHRLAREYLAKNDNGRGEAYFKSKALAEQHDRFSPKKMGRGLSELEDADLPDIAIERWGSCRSTRWKVEHIE